MARPYAGAPVSQKFRERWMTSSQIGAIKPAGMVEIRTGRLVRHMHPFPGKPEFNFPAFGEYPEALAWGFWFPDWQVDSDWLTLDAIQNIRIEQSFDNNGVSSLTLKMDNKALVPTSGAGGALYHLVEKGYYSPLRGFVGKHRPDPGITKTPFFGNKLHNAQIRVRQGYGADELVTTFLGLIDDIETDTTPNEITITARDHGGVLVDEHFFGWAKEKDMRPPVTFAPRRLAQKHRLEGGGAESSSHQDGYPSSEAMSSEGVAWRSKLQSTRDDTQWIEFHVPEGRYSQLYLRVPFENMHAYIGMRPKPNRQRETKFNGKHIDVGGDGFYNPHGTLVPGTFGGWAYFTEIRATRGGKGHYISLRGEFNVGDDTIIRVGFRNLGKVDGGYQARVNYLQANHRTFRPSAIAGRYILIDDVSDIVRCCLRWCGFKNWEVENTGTNLKEVYIADASKSFMDVINEVKDMVGFTFFIGEPRDDDNDQDLGWPIFRNNRVFENRTAKTEHISDKLLLTDARVKITNADDRCMIRCRGITKRDGVTLGADSLERIMFAYIPPWAGEQAAKQAGVIKSITHTDEKFTRLSDCQFGCYLIALQIALGKYSVLLDLPGNPGIGLDTLQSVIDREQGFNSRVYITNRTQEMQFGKSGHWTLELGGAAVDTPEVDGVLKDYKAAIKVLDRGGRNPWLRKRHGKTLAYGYEDR